MQSVIWAIKNNTILFALLMAAIAVYLIAWAVGVTSADALYDKVIHFVLPALGALFLYVVFVRGAVLPMAPRTVGVVLMVLMLGISIETVWEIFEFATEEITGINIQYGNWDTMWDLTMATLGSLIAGVWYAYNRDKMRV